MGESAIAAETLGAMLLRLAGRAGYSGRDAYAYLTDRLGPGVTVALLHERVPSDWTACEAIAARHRVDMARLWDLLLEDRPAGEAPAAG